jgi:hypothetical protein
LFVPPNIHALFEARSPVTKNVYNDNHNYD